MKRSKKSISLGFLALIGFGLCFAILIAPKSIVRTLIAFTILDVAIWFGIAVAPIANRARYGGRKSLDEILADKNCVQVVRLLRYHLGWSPSKIAAELNRREIFNLGLPWHEDDVRRIIKGIGSFTF